MIVLATERAGYGDLCRILTESHKDKPKNEGNLHFADFLARASPGWILLPRFQKEIKTDLDRLKEVFPQRVYLPLCRYLDGKDHERTQRRLAQSQKWDLPIVAINDVYYHTKARKPLQDVLISIREGKPLSEVGFHLFSNGERCIKGPQRMAQLFRDLPKALRATVEIAEQCTFSPRELRYTYPSEWIPEQHTAQSYLEYLVWQRAPEIYKGAVPEAVVRQIHHELKMIGSMQYADYFLTIYDIVQFARSREILCQGRGSAANSVVCFVLGITAVDPVKMNLLFERFISPERGEPPDIDVDFEHERREEVIQYIYEKYGRHRAAMVSAVVTYQWRSAFREVCKAFGVPVGTLSAQKVERDFEELTKDLPQREKLKVQILHLTEELYGFPRHLSIHSGGFTLSADPITEIVPVIPARMENRTIIQWDKYDLDELGLLKVDVLSLGMLSALNKMLNLVGKKLYELPVEDPATYKMIQRRDTVGTFQIESRAQMSMLGRLQPQTFYDLVIEVAIVRPGPIVGNMVHPYLRRKRGLEKVEFPSEKVRAILGRTLGVPLFQEQVMKLAIELANFTPAEADRLRRSINAWRSSAPIAEMADRLMKGLLAGGLPKAFADQIFEQIQGFSMYGFPESHAASFAFLAYASSYLKCHHPAEFAASLINSQPMGFYRNDTLIYDALRHGVKVLPVCILRSQWDCVVESPKTIRLGFRVVKGIAKKAVDDLLAEREHQTFKDLKEFLRKTTLNKDVLHRLALAGRLSSKDLDARQTLWAMLEYENLFACRESAQLSLFDSLPMDWGANKAIESMSGFEKIQSDYTAFHLSTHGHPMGEIRQKVRGLPKTTSSQLNNKPHGARVAVAGLVLVRQKPPTAKGTVFCTLEDEYGFIDLILHATTYKAHKAVFMNHCFIHVSGLLQRDGYTISVLVKSVKPVWSEVSQEQTPLAIDPTTYFYG
jgi:error-prone DNA polymerase